MSLDFPIQGRERIADWIETTLLARGTRPLGHDELHALADAEIHQGAAQGALGLGVMKRRSDLLGHKYPFVVHDIAVRSHENSVLFPYSCLLMLTPEGVARQTVVGDSTEDMEILFERISEAALSNLWGESGRAIRFGWPSDVGRPQGFNEAVIWLAEQIGIKPGSGFRPPRRKDGGVDVVAWRPFRDGKGGVPLILVQCTIQSDILPKATDVDSRVWASWLVLDFDPITALAVPQTIASGTLWDQLALRGMVLDRLRLSELVPDSCIIAGMHDWSQSVIDQLTPLLAGSAP